jgi:type I restriction enzyme M protein
MLTGEIRSQIDSIWNDFWSGGVSNPLSVIEQITYLLFIKRLDELQTVEERKAAQLKIPMERRLFSEGKDERGRPYEDLRWSRFKSFEAREMFKVVDEHVFPFLRTRGGEGSAFGEHMKDARLGIPTPALLAKAVEKLDAVRMDDRDTKGDVYEYMLGKIASAGKTVVPHATPHHRAHGGAHGADADGPHLRPRGWHLRLPRRCGRISASQASRSAARPEAA